MCEPVSMAVASFVVGTASSVMNFASKSAEAEAQTGYYNTNRENAINAANYDDQMLALRQIQEQKAADEKIFQNNLETKKKVAHATAAANDAGITGLSVEGLLRDFAVAGERVNANIRDNKEMTLSQLDNERQGARFKMTDRINSVRPGVKPSGAALGLQIAAGGIDSYSKYKTFTKT